VSDVAGKRCYGANKQANLSESGLNYAKIKGNAVFISSSDL
jgi:hypothetical protein